MRYNVTINNIKAKEFGLNIQQAYVFAWLYELPSWATSYHFNGENYYFASRFKAIQELPLLTDKADTMYRYYKQLEQKKLILLIKIVNKDYVLLTKKGKTWNEAPKQKPLDDFNILGKFSDHSENNPSKLGKFSKMNSENFPTYNYTSIYNNTKNNCVGKRAQEINVNNLKKETLDPADPFLIFICGEFDQNREVLQMRVHSFLRHLINLNRLQEFKEQTKAYLKYKQLANEKRHRWESYKREWDQEDWISKLKKLNSNGKVAKQVISGKFDAYS